MNPRAAELIVVLGLRPHPEGGHYRRIFQSDLSVQPRDGRAERLALTSIFFLLSEGEVGRWHRVASDEAWHYYEGDPLELIRADGAFREVRRDCLGPVGDGVKPVCVVSGNEWQAARSTGAYTLVGCTVGPGFEFEDFQMLREHAAEAEKLRQAHPDLARFL